MKDMIIVNPGLHTTVQDKGRWGYQEFGMPVTGAMDDYSIRLANILVGNHEYDAVLETTLMGPEIAFNIDAVIAITGANMMPRVNGHIVPMWRSLLIYKGDVLSFSFSKEGTRSCIAIAGGFDIPTVMGSRSTFVRGGIGGFEGRILKKGDELSVRESNAVLQQIANRIIPQKYIPDYKESCRIRTVLGPQDDCFTEESIDKFFGSEYHVTNEADRMGYRLEGPALEHKNGADIISDGINLGSIQIPGHGMPIVMMADRQTTGGYTKIATVISTDIPLMAQLKPGNKVRFERIDLQEAHRLLREYEDKISAIKSYVSSNQLEPGKSKYFSVKVGGTSYEVMVEELK